MYFHRKCKIHLRRANFSFHPTYVCTYVRSRFGKDEKRKIFSSRSSCMANDLPRRSWFAQQFRGGCFHNEEAETLFSCAGKFIILDCPNQVDHRLPPLSDAMALRFSSKPACIEDHRTNGPLCYRRRCSRFHEAEDQRRARARAASSFH